MISPGERLDALPTMRPAQLRALWRDVWRQLAPDIGPSLLRFGIAWKIQARVHGDLPVHVRREIDAVLTRLRRGEPAAPSRPSLRPGARLIREWQGRTYAVIVVDRGYEYDGRQFRSLTQVATAITGTHQSGLNFFGLKPRKGLKSRAAS